ncbi:MAG TPA: molybdopterin-binding protein [Candidatus Saccharimonadales bacterium]|nr:molybdopterin-binding protein [Candidatus Saccharimonadales bacterium]
MRTARINPGEPADETLVGSVLTRDLSIGGQRWSKGRRLTIDDLGRLADPPVPSDGGAPLRIIGRTAAPNGVTVVVLEPGDLHEDEAACRLAQAIAGPSTMLRGPAESRVDLLAVADGVVHVRIGALERFNRIDPLEAFTLFDGQIVRAGELVASVKVAPHVVATELVERGEAVAADGPLFWVAPFQHRRVGVIVKENVVGAARERFERSVRQKIEGIGSEIVGIDYVEDDPRAVEAAMAAFSRGRGHGRGRVDLILTAGAASTDPDDAVFVALGRLRGRIVRRGVPSHPGSMLWLGRIGTTAVVGLPTCGAYSKATAADLLLPRLLSGDPPTAATVARLGHGGVLNRQMRFRFPAYALDLEAPEG